MQRSYKIILDLSASGGFVIRDSFIIRTDIREPTCPPNPPRAEKVDSQPTCPPKHSEGGFVSFVFTLTERTL